MKFTVIFRRDITQTYETLISAKSEDAAYEKAEAMIDKGIPDKKWDDDNETVEIQDVYEE